MTSEAPGRASGIDERGSRSSLTTASPAATLNAHGLHLDLHVDGERCWTELSIPSRFQGWDEIAHGGIVSTILDEVMAWALVDTDNWGLTARLRVDFKRPVPLGRPIRAEGWVTRRTAARGHDGRPDRRRRDGGEVLATAEATYVAAPEDRKRELKERYGYPPVDRRRRMTAAPRARPRRARDRPGEPRHRARRRVRRGAQAGRRSARAAASPSSSATRTPSRPRSARTRAPRRPGVPRGPAPVAPGIGAVIGVRWPLIEAVKRGFREATRRERTSTWLFVADRLLREEALEPRWFAFGLLERTIADEPERTWQLVRRAAREADEWITVDSLAHVVGKGILAEPYRWAELEQLVYSPSRWERRLVGSTIATIPFVDRAAAATPERRRSTGSRLIGQLIGDAEPDVQKALSWALRSLVTGRRRRP